jgi:hypothetical protein
MGVLHTVRYEQSNLARLMIQVMAMIAICVLVAKPLYAADWEQFRGRYDVSTKVFVDDSSVEIEHDTVVKGWVKLEYPAPQTRDGIKMISHSTYRMANCDTRRYWVLEDWANPGGSVEPVRLEISNVQEWRVATPGSESEMALDALCYETRSLLGMAWDGIKRHYENAKAEQAAKR